MQFDFESMKNTIVSAGKEMGDKAKEASSLAKIRLDIRAKEDFIQKQYTELGKLYYSSQVQKEEQAECADVTEENASAAADTVTEAAQETETTHETETTEEKVLCFEEMEEVKACLESIRQAQEEIKDLNFQILNTKGAVVCPNCGLTQDQGNAFCKSCGTKLSE